MNTLNSERLPGEQRLVEHYRAHDDGQPSSALDAMILAAAREAVAPARKSLLARLRDLMRQPQRFALAFGSLASMALVLGLVLKGLPQDPHIDDRQLAPVLREELGEPLAAQKKQDLPRAVMPSPAPLNREAARMSAAPSMEALADQPAAAAEIADVDAGYAPQSMSKPLVPPLISELDKELNEVLQLRERGLGQEAQQLLQVLRKRHPQLDLDARLEQLQHSDTP